MYEIRPRKSSSNLSFSRPYYYFPIWAGRYQYLTGYLKACKNIITENEKHSFGEAKYLDGYTDGLDDGIQKCQQIIEKAVDNATGGWADEATEWRKIAQEFIINISKAKQNE